MNYENRKENYPMKNNYKKLICYISAITIITGILFGSTTNVEAREYTTDIHFLSDDTIFEAGDIANVKNCISNLHLFWSDGTNQIQDDNFYTPIDLGYYKINFPTEIVINGTSYKNPKWHFIKYEFLGDPASPVEYLFFQLYTETPSPVSASAPAPSTPSHECSFQWVTTVEPQPDADGLEEYKCTGCGAVQEQKPIPASVASVQNLCGFVYNAPQNGTVTTDFGRLHTISDYILKKMAERSDVTSIIQFEYKNQKLQIIFPAGTDYSPVLNDDDMMYGFYGIAPRLGLSVTER